MSDDEISLETLLAKAANPLNKELDLEAVRTFHDVMAEEIEGPQTALSFLAYRIQSPQEKEATMALLVLEECVKKSNPRFLNEVGKFRFLNELIKVVSPKYLGNRAPYKVKQKILELMFKWSVELKHESKINEAYQMLRKQGVISEDPVHVLEDYEAAEAPSPRTASSIFEDEEKSKLLQTLLQSKDPQDLLAANTLIKSMVKETDRRMELMARTMTEIDAVHSNAKVLSDMLDHYNSVQTSEEEKDLMKELFESCERLRPKLFRLAGEMDEKDRGLDDILKANDELTAVIGKYRHAMGMEETNSLINNTTGSKPTNGTMQEASLMDLGSPIATVVKSRPDTSLLDEQLLNLGLNDIAVGGAASSLPEYLNRLPSYDSLNSNQDNSSSTQKNVLSELGSIFSASNMSSASTDLLGLNLLRPTNPTAMPPPTIPFAEETTSADIAHKSNLSGLAELDVISQSLMKQSLPLNVTKVDFPSGTPQKVPMNQLPHRQISAPHSPLPNRAAELIAPSAVAMTTATTTILEPTTVFTSSTTASPSRGVDAFSLADICVPLETIQPGSLAPLTLHEKDGLTVVVHFGRDSPRDDVTVMVVSTMSKNLKCPVKNVKFQAAVPKTMKIKLQPPSATNLPVHNPILPTAAITQVMLLANPNKDNKVRLKYKISYSINDETRTDFGEVESLLAPSSR